MRNSFYVFGLAPRELSFCMLGGASAFSFGCHVIRELFFFLSCNPELSSLFGFTKHSVIRATNTVSASIVSVSEMLWAVSKMSIDMGVQRLTWGWCL
jgi:hypothetical protein